ncbi:hypothetical protein [Fibrella aquatilis]|uniref:Uncharacterized protein n=1 Tax=Fibrella aquatilis TaxID=2817059 RepID=A0A939K1H0_9BACT|nr:hypothetical protein [Fibrella aquatilis]MBO0932260.1 hypothetical protein [Fibrella aquatilis]
MNDETWFLIITIEHIKNEIDMGLFDFLKPKKKKQVLTFYSERLTDVEKVSINLMMVFIVTHLGQRVAHSEEKKFVTIVSNEILGLNNQIISNLKGENFDYTKVVYSLELENKKFFAGTFIELANIIKDQSVMKLVAVIVEDMGLSFEDVVKEHYKGINM